MSESTTSVADPTGRNWKRIALAGAGIGLLLALIRSGSVTERELGFAFWILVAWMAAMAMGFRHGRRALVTRPELLVPIGIVLPIDVVLTWLADTPKLNAIMQPIASLALWGIGIAVSFPFASNIALWTMLAAWQTDLLLRAQSNPGPLDLAPWAPIRRGFWRAFGALAIGAGGMALCSVPLVALLGPSSFSGFAVGLLVVAVFWNLATFAILPWVMHSPEGFAIAVKTGIRESWRRKWRWSPLIVAQLLMLGAMTYYSYRRGGSSSWSFNVHNPWVGGYECRTNWYADHQAWAKVPESPFAVAVLKLAFLALAVAVKVSVLTDLLAKPESTSIPEIGPERGEQT